MTIVAIDGPAGTGKSSVAKRVAARLGFFFLETGAMYRAVTYGLLKHRIPLENEEAIANYMDALELSLGDKGYILEGELLIDQLRGEAVTRAVSQVSALFCVREKLVALQRSLAKGCDLVLEGRDIGTVVFPDAAYKIFLTASSTKRAERRLLQEGGGDLLKVREEIERRDKFDSERALSPLKPAKDAILIDTSDYTLDEVVEKVLGIVAKKNLPRNI
jgi:cytidylate kinase